MYNKKFVNVNLYNEELVDYCHLINLAGKILDYDKVTEKFDILPNNSSFIEFTKLCAALPSCWKENKKYQLPDNHLSAFRSALNNNAFSTKWVYIGLREFNIEYGDN